MWRKTLQYEKTRNLFSSFVPCSRKAKLPVCVWVGGRPGGRTDGIIWLAKSKKPKIELNSNNQAMWRGFPQGQTLSHPTVGQHAVLPHSSTETQKKRVQQLFPIAGKKPENSRELGQELKKKKIKGPYF